MSPSTMCLTLNHRKNLEDSRYCGLYFCSPEASFLNKNLKGSLFSLINCANKPSIAVEEPSVERMILVCEYGIVDIVASPNACLENS